MFARQEVVAVSGTSKPAGLDPLAVGAPTAPRPAARLHRHCRKRKAAGRDGSVSLLRRRWTEEPLDCCLNQRSVSVWNCHRVWLLFNCSSLAGVGAVLQAPDNLVALNVPTHYSYGPDSNKRVFSLDFLPHSPPISPLFFESWCLAARRSSRSTTLRPKSAFPTLFILHVLWWEIC